MPVGMKETVERIFAFDVEAECEFIAARIRELVGGRLRKQGAVVAVSGGVDSAVCCALAVRGLGPERVFGLLMPERDSPSEGLDRGVEVVRGLGVEHAVEDITAALEAVGCYAVRDEAIRAVFPAYGQDWKSKIAIAGGSEGRYNHFRLVVRSPEGEVSEERLGLREYLRIVAATNFKQRIRKTLEYFHADRLNYAVVGTPNRLEHDQGFFVKNGDGSADLKPIAHLYKVQVYMLARHLGLPASVCDSTPTTGTYSLAQGQDGFYFALGHDQMDVALWHHHAGKPPSELAEVLGMDEARARLVYEDIAIKRRTTGPLHWPGLLVRPVDGPVPAPGPA